MKTSELIRRLQELVAEHGDVYAMVDGCCDPYPQYVVLRI